MLWALIPSKLKLYGLIALTVILGVVGIYFAGAENAKSKQRLKIAEGRVKAMKKERKVRRDVENSDDDALIRGILRKRK